MKKYLLLAITGFAFNSIQAQDVSEALRYAQTDLGGTARFKAMSGAFGALGGDFSSLNVNPAGGAIFTTSQIALTLSNRSLSNKSNYFGTATKENDNSFDMNQLGAIWVLENDNPDSGWRRLTIGANYENLADLDNRIYSQGYNPNNSISSYFLNYANSPEIGNFSGNFPLTLEQQQANLGYQGFVINPAGNSPQGNAIYTSNAPAGGNYYQENFTSSTGYNGKLSFNIATQYKDKFYFGLNLNSHFTDYTRKTSFYEDYLETPGTQTNLEYTRLNNELYRYGNGFSFQLGAIAKVTNSLRAGLAYESPTWYNFTEDLRQVVYTNIATYDTGIIPYPDYRLQTPGKYTGSLAYVFGKLGLISVDYAMKDYSNTRFRSDDSYFDPINSQMNDILDVTSEVRIGAEARVKQWSFRGGYRFEQSPYKNGKTVGDLNSVSGGLGYNFGPVRADASYAYAKRDSQMSFFSTGLTNPANIKSVSNTVSLTLLFEM